MGAILGLLFHSLGGFASGSFYIPYRKIYVWSWESAWLVGGVFSWLIVPIVAAYLTIPDFMKIIQTVDSDVFFWTFTFGVLWGIGGLTFGWACRLP
jgi:L-rhamnose-H+ transport protein